MLPSRVWGGYHHQQDMFWRNGLSFFAMKLNEAEVSNSAARALTASPSLSLWAGKTANDAACQAGLLPGLELPAKAPCLLSS